METKVRRFFCSFLVLLAFSCGTLRPTPAAYLVEKVWEFSQSRPEGFTLELSTWTEPKEGISAAYELAESCVDISGLEFVINHAQAHEGFVGGWLNSADSLYYFDSVRIFPVDSLDAAIRFGRANGQIAIYNLSTGEEIRLIE